MLEQNMLVWEKVGLRFTLDAAPGRPKFVQSAVSCCFPLLIDE